MSMPFKLIFFTFLFLQSHAIWGNEVVIIDSYSVESCFKSEENQLYWKDFVQPENAGHFFEDTTDCVLRLMSRGSLVDMGISYELYTFKFKHRTIQDQYCYEAWLKVFDKTGLISYDLVYSLKDCCFSSENVRSVLFSNLVLCRITENDKVIIDLKNSSSNLILYDTKAFAINDLISRNWNIRDIGPTVLSSDYPESFSVGDVLPDFNTSDTDFICLGIRRRLLGGFEVVGYKKSANAANSRSINNFELRTYNRKFELVRVKAYNSSK
ncbi:MAG: hypothetical protein RL204_138 [Bacteroidota bacterium]|jgi:hypothetical protein